MFQATIIRNKQQINELNTKDLELYIRNLEVLVKKAKGNWKALEERDFPYGVISESQKKNYVKELGNCYRMALQARPLSNIAAKTTPQFVVDKDKETKKTAERKETPLEDKLQQELKSLEEELEKASSYERSMSLKNLISESNVEQVRVEAFKLLSGAQFDFKWEMEYGRHMLPKEQQMDIRKNIISQLFNTIKTGELPESFNSEEGLFKKYLTDDFFSKFKRKIDKLHDAMDQPNASHKRLQQQLQQSGLKIADIFSQKVFSQEGLSSETTLALYDFSKLAVDKPKREPDQIRKEIRKKHEEISKNAEKPKVSKGFSSKSKPFH